MLQPNFPATMNFMLQVRNPMQVIILDTFNPFFAGKPLRKLSGVKSGNLKLYTGFVPFVGRAWRATMRKIRGCPSSRLLKSS